MCINQENVPTEELDKFRDFVNGLEETPLATFLTIVGQMIEQGGSICIGHIPTPEEAAALQQQMQQQIAPQPPPGIYPPQTFSAPEPGTGQYL